MFTFCPLQGARSESHTSQSLLEFDGGIKLLIGVGWDESFDPERLKELQKHVPTISLILLTHPTVPHLAAYAHCCKTIPLFSRIPVYATRPVIDLGRTLIQDLYASSPAAATTILSQTVPFEGTATTTAAAADFLLQAPTPDEIARYFSAVQALKYSQPHQPVGSPLSPPLSGLTVTAYNAGHTLGGTIWHIQHGLESVVYAVDWNQARENVFAGAAWLGGAGGADVIEQLRKPTALVCSSRGAADRATSQQGGRARRDEQLLEMIRTCVSRGGTVLIPIDSSARVLEVAYLLEHAWRSDGPDDRGPGVLRSSKLFLAGRNMSTTMRYARSMLEWMDDAVVREFEAVADNMRRTGGPADSRRDAAGPLDFRFLRLLEKPGQIDRLLGQAATAAGLEPHPGGRVFIASDSSMEWGFSKDLLRGLAADPNNLVILTEKPALCGSGRPSAARTLWDWWKEGRDGVATERDGAAAAEESPDLIHGRGRELSIRREARQPLEGEDLGAYQQWMAAQRQLQAAEAGGAAAAAGLDAAVDAADDGSESSSSSDESDTEQQGKALTVSAALNQANRKHVVLKDEDLGVNILVKKKGAYDFFCRSRRDRDRAFPVVIRKRRMDGDYGEPIRQEDYLRTEEREEAREGAGAADEEDKLGKKRKWDRGGGAGAGAGGGAGARAFGGPNGSASTNDMDMLRASAGLMSDPDLDEADDPSEDLAVVASQGPCRLVVSTETVPVHLRLGYVDFTGLHDRRSLHMLIPLIQPRKLILVAGAEEETLALAEDCRKLLGGGGARTDTQPAAEGGGGGGACHAAVDVYTPVAGTWVNASVDTNAWVLKLGEPLAKGLMWQRVKGISVVTLSGQLFDQVAAAAAAAAAANAAAAASDDYRQDGANKRQKTEEPEDHHRLPATALAEPALPVLDNALGAAAPRVMVARRPLHVGDVRLADLRRGLQSAGHAAEFRGEGTLLVDGSVAVRKGAAGLVEVENWGWGTRREAFLEVRRMVYESLALVRGG